MSKAYRSPSHRRYRASKGADNLEIYQTRRALREIHKEGFLTGPIMVHGQQLSRRARHLNVATPILKSKRWLSTIKFPYHRKLEQKKWNVRCLPVSTRPQLRL